MTFVGEPSVFVHVMEPEIELLPAVDEQRFLELVGTNGQEGVAHQPPPNTNGPPV